MIGKDIKKLDHIDALRGVAILMVIATHIAPHFSGLNVILAGLAAYGRMGVQLFFLISAFTLCLSMAYRANEKNAYGNFFIRRFFRIAPVYYLGIVIYTGISIAQGGVVEWNYVFSHIVLLHGLYPDAFMNVVPGGWSIGVEFLFYMCFPFLFFLIVEKRDFIRVFLFLFVSVFIAMGVVLAINHIAKVPSDGWNITYWNFFNQLPVFVLGMCLFKFVEAKVHLRVPLYISCILFFLFTFLSIFLYRAKPPFFVNFIVFFSGMSFVFLFFIFERLSFLNNRFLVFVGRTSFSMYVIHFLVIEFYFSKVYGFFPSKAINLMALVHCTIILAVTFLLAKYSEKYIEQNGIKVGKKFLNMML